MRIQEQEQIKQAVDVAAASATAAAVMEWVPPVTAVATLIWVLLRIWESDTVREMTNRQKPD